MVRHAFIFLSLVISALTLFLANDINTSFYWLFLLFEPLIILGHYDIIQTKHTILKHFELT